MLLAQRLLAIKDGMDRVEKEVNLQAPWIHHRLFPCLREKTLKS